MVKKIRGCSKAVQILAIILRIAIIIAFICSLALTVYLFTIQRGTYTWVANGKVDITVDFTKLNFAQEVKNLIISKLGSSRTFIRSGAVGGDAADLAWLMLPLLSSLIFSYLILLFIGSIAKKLSSSDKLFSCGAEKPAISLGVTLICRIIVNSLLQSILIMILQRSSGIIALRLSLNINFTTVIFVLGYIVLFLLYKYGGTLEKAAATAECAVPASTLSAETAQSATLSAEKTEEPVADKQTSDDESSKLIPEPLSDDKPTDTDKPS